MLIVKLWCELCMNCDVRMDMFSDHITNLYFIRTEIHFSYVMSTDNLD